jgi:RNA polymerase sigma-70 factor, ECF subfamily
MEKKTTDIELVLALKKGCQHSYAELVERYGQKVHNLALRITRNEQDTEDVMQEVFITIWTKIDMFQGRSAFSSWLYRVTANCAFMKLRSRRKHNSVSFEETQQADSSDTTGLASNREADVSLLSSRHELRDAIEDAVAKLPEDYRAIFILRDIDGLSNQEVAEVLKLSVPAIKSRLHRSRILLRKRLQRIYLDYSNADAILYSPTYKEELASAANVA